MSNKIQITVVVNGQTTIVEANLNAPIKTVVNKALADTQNTGQPADKWELRDEAGNLLDIDEKVEDFNFPEGVTLFLSLKAGQAG